MTKSQRDFLPRSHPFLYVSADLDLPLVPHALNLFFSGQEMTPLPERSSPLDRKLIHTPKVCTEPGASSFLDEKEEEENLYFSLSPRHTQLSLSLPTTVTYVFISEILSFFCRHFFLLERCRRFAGVFERPFSRARNQTAFFPHPPST